MNLLNLSIIDLTILFFYFPTKIIINNFIFINKYTEMVDIFS